MSFWSIYELSLGGIEGLEELKIRVEDVEEKGQRRKKRAIWLDGRKGLRKGGREKEGWA